MQLLVATQNKGKQQELRRVLALGGLELVFPSGIAELQTLDPPETGSTFAENAELKARAFAELYPILTVAEDSGLAVTALQGAPGVASKRWHIGSDTDRNTALLDRLVGVQDRSAKFITAAYLFDPKTATGICFFGELSGTIAHKSAGEAGFGYDPIFIPEGENKSMAVLGLAYKNSCSHRAKAFQKVRDYLSKKI